MASIVSIDETRIQNYLRGIQKLSPLQVQQIARFVVETFAEHSSKIEAAFEQRFNALESRLPR